ncbi:MAG TPA: acetylxylan esterase [Thermoanaerobaculia bacterium]|nr:acetylxylan esterase [Thermoanaerobaculia bacterium]
MTILFEKRRLGAAPALIARPSSARLPLPTVLWFHGFTAGKATHRPELATLAEAGFLAVGIDAAGHGERRLPDFEERFSGTKDETDREFYALVAATAAEVPGIIDLLRGAGLADEARIGAAGVSMGGMITYGAAAIDPRIRAAVALLASPEWPHPASPHPWRSIGSSLQPSSSSRRGGTRPFRPPRPAPSMRTWKSVTASIPNAFAMWRSRSVST